jgi:hypothetical protein
VRAAEPKKKDAKGAVDKDGREKDAKADVGAEILFPIDGDFSLADLKKTDVTTVQFESRAARDGWIVMVRALTVEAMCPSYNVPQGMRDQVALTNRDLLPLSVMFFYFLFFFYFFYLRYIYFFALTNPIK